MYVCMWLDDAGHDGPLRSGNKPLADCDIEACREVMGSEVESM